MDPRYPRSPAPAPASIEPVDWKLKQPVREWLLWLVAGTTSGLLPVKGA